MKIPSLPGFAPRGIVHYSLSPSRKFHTPDHLHSHELASYLNTSDSLRYLAYSHERLSHTLISFSLPDSDSFSFLVSSTPDTRHTSTLRGEGVARQVRGMRDEGWDSASSFESTYGMDVVLAACNAGACRTSTKGTTF